MPITLHERVSTLPSCRRRHEGTEGPEPVLHPEIATMGRPVAFTLRVYPLLVGILTAAVLLWEGESVAVSDAGFDHRGVYTLEERIQKHAEAVEARTKPQVLAAGVPYPPPLLAYVALKDTAQLEVYARGDQSAPWRRVLTYPILGLSGNLGPKLRQGDKQVPEGIYRAELLNANSRFHLSIRLDFPNALDLAHAQAEGREDPGSDIMIHGDTASTGCLAMGDQAAEDLFILAALAGKEQVEVLIAPTDLRRHPAPSPEGAPSWLPDLYHTLKAALSQFPNEASPKPD